jgi:hypothetical protein
VASQRWVGKERRSGGREGGFYTKFLPSRVDIHRHWGLGLLGEPSPRPSPMVGVRVIHIYWQVYPHISSIFSLSGSRRRQQACVQETSPAPLPPALLRSVLCSPYPRLGRFPPPEICRMDKTDMNRSLG